MCDRVEGVAGARKTPIGFLPTKNDLDLSGLRIPAESLDELLMVDPEQWRKEADSIEEHLKSFGKRMPKALKDELAGLRQRLQ